jgi:iron-sulfur cluster repair protein YtfE (RIC family)
METASQSNDPVWTSRSADQARSAILAQHHIIRMLLQAAGAVADLAAGGNRRVADLLPHYLENVRATLEHHLGFEEEVLVPLLVADPPLGPERAERLKEEHARQRAELAVLVRAGSEATLPQTVVAQRLRALVDAFLEDMSLEERALLRSDVLRDDLVSVEQDCG